MLASSQAPLSVPGEQLYGVGPLAVAADDHGPGAAVQLFLDRARRQDRRFTADEPTLEAVAEVCRRLDGLPLALELAAARMAAMSPRDLADRLAGRFRLLRGGARTAGERHRTLRALVDWSYDLLDPGEQAVFEVLSVFAGSFTLDQAEQLAGQTLAEAGPAAEHVLTLVERSMVVAVPGAPTTYHLLETLRTYGRERLAERPYADVARERHAALFARLVAGTPAAFWTARHRTSVALVSSCLDELRAAFAWALVHDPATAARLVAGSAILLEHRMTAEVAHWAETLVARLDEQPPGTVPPDEHAWALGVSAAGARFAGALDLALSRADRAAELAESPLVQCYARYVEAEAALFQGDEARSLALEATLAAAAEQQGLHSLGRLLTVTRALTTAYSGDSRAASATAAAVQVEADGLGEDVVAAWAAYARGETLLEEDPTAAGPLLADALERATQIGDRYLTGVTLVSLASLRGRHGDPREARPLFRRAVEHWHRAGSWTHQWTTLRNVVVLLARLGEDRTAAVVAGALGTRRTSARATGAEAARMRETHDGLVARLGQQAYDEAVEVGTRLSDDALVGYVLDGLTGGAGRSGRS